MANDVLNHLGLAASLSDIDLEKLVIPDQNPNSSKPLVAGSIPAAATRPNFSRFIWYATGTLRLEESNPLRKAVPPEVLLNIASAWSSLAGVECYARSLLRGIWRYYTQSSPCLMVSRPVRDIIIESLVEVLDFTQEPSVGLRLLSCWIDHDQFPLVIEAGSFQGVLGPHISIR